MYISPQASYTFNDIPSLRLFWCGRRSFEHKLAKAYTKSGELAEIFSRCKKISPRFCTSTYNLQVWYYRSERVLHPITPHKTKSRVPLVLCFCWCGRRELNPYCKTTRPSNERVCQFRHSRNGLLYYTQSILVCQAFF